MAGGTSLFAQAGIELVVLRAAAAVSQLTRFNNANDKVTNGIRNQAKEASNAARVFKEYRSAQQLSREAVARATVDAKISDISEDKSLSHIEKMKAIRYLQGQLHDQLKDYYRSSKALEESSPF